MKHLRLFENEAVYEAAKDKIEKPYVAFTEDDSKVQYGGGGEPQPTYEMVDLGLPSGLKWAKCNIGAIKEEEYGLYFQWGDIEGRTADELSDKPCSWSTAPFNNGSSSFDSRYFNAHKSEWLDGDVLKPQYDAAHVKMGPQYSFPTKADWDELLGNTTNKWTTVNGVNGRLFTSKTNGNSIFIPASGYAGGGSMNNIGSYVGVWSSNFNTSYPSNAWNLRAGSSNCYLDYNNRGYGFSLRGVLRK